MIAAILCGGKGTRLLPLTKNLPKPLVKIENKALLDYHLALLKRHNITKVIVTLNYLPEKVLEHLKHVKGFEFMPIVEKKPLGTAGALAEIEETTLVIYGDVLINMNLDRFVKFHKEKKADASLVVHKSSHFQDSDVLWLGEDARVKGIIHRPKTEEHGTLTNAGMYLIEPKCLKEIQKKYCDFAKDLFPVWIKEHKVFGYETDEYLRDIGTMDRYKKVSEDIKNGSYDRGRLP